MEYLGHEISGKVFGMIGIGDIAMKTAYILKHGFHMKMIGYSRSLTKQKAIDLDIEYCETMEEVFQRADYISIGMALSKDNLSYH